MAGKGWKSLSEVGWGLVWPGQVKSGSWKAREIWIFKYLFYNFPHHAKGLGLVSIYVGGFHRVPFIVNIIYGYSYQTFFFKHACESCFIKVYISIEYNIIEKFEESVQCNFNCIDHSK